VVVGGGTSAVQLTMQLARVTTTTWVTRRPPAWRDEEFSPEIGREAVARVAERTRAGLMPESVVSVTGLPLTDAYREAIDAGVLRARPMFTRIVAEGVVWDDPAPVPVPAPVSAGEVAAADSAEQGATAVGTARLGGWVDGPGFVEARTILWCTGFRASLDHLAPLHLRGAGGGIVMDGTRVVADPRIQLVGYGPSASTIGANRAGREAVRNLRRTLGL
jgi:cation diffusion facilitator CzcD-associated flavoprotein CzcO